MNLTAVLQKNAKNFHALVPFDLNARDVWVPDLTSANPVLHKLNLTDTEAVTAYIFGEMKLRNTDLAIGGYGEDRFLYHRSPHFSGSLNRTIHLGIDLWAVAGTPVYAPLSGTVHSFANNADFGDYGYTLILEHQLEDTIFFTLYGHLSQKSIAGKWEGQPIEKGEEIAWFGTPAENGNWTPHLHFQVIADMQGRQGDFPGVANRLEAALYLALCPDPNLILGCPQLNKK